MKNLFSREEFKLDELLFQNRNQEYGAYNLRHESDNMLTKAMFVGVVLFGAISATPFIINSFKVESISAPVDTSGKHGFVQIPETPEVKPPVQTVLQTKPQEATTIYNIPTPASNPIVETPGTDVTTFKDNNIGLETIDGTAPTGSFTPPDVIVGPPVTPPFVAPKVVPDFPAKVDVEAKFVRGIDAFRNGMISNFDTGYFEGTGDVVKTTITFIVEKDGSISDIKAKGTNAEFNKEAMKTIKSIKGKWTPAKLDGQFVRSYFSFPVSMKFE